MQAINPWNKLNLHRNKIVAIVTLFILAIADQVQAQSNNIINLPYSDEKKMHYGFTIGLHSSNLRVKHSQEYVDSIDSLHSIMANNAFGFSLGFITDFRLADQFNFRILPKVAFYEFPVDYNFTDGTTDPQLIEATYVEMPILFKYKSERHTNFRMYVVAGINPWFEASGKKRKEQSTNKLITQDFNLSAELGVGVDIYYPLFKFSPEIRLSRGLLNILKEDKFGYSDGIETLTTNVVSIYFQFSD